MKVICIFDKNLWSIQYDGHERDVFSEMFTNWTDMEYLFDYFTRNKEYLSDPFWSGWDIPSLIRRTYNEALSLDRYFHGLYKNIKHCDKPDLESHFVWLDKQYEYQLGRYKSYGQICTPIMLRIYAIRVEENVFVVTGGGIKLVRQMKNMPELDLELTHIKDVRSYLRKNDIETSGDIYEFIKDE